MISFVPSSVAVGLEKKTDRQSSTASHGSRLPSPPTLPIRQPEETLPLDTARLFLTLHSSLPVGFRAGHWVAKRANTVAGTCCGYLSLVSLLLMTECGALPLRYPHLHSQALWYEQARAYGDP